MDDGDLKRVEWRKRVFQALILLFLLFNLLIRFGTIFRYPPCNGVIAGFLSVVTAACLFVIFKPQYLKHLLFVFGFSFFLFGFGAIDIQSRIFELIVTIVATTLFAVSLRKREQHRWNRPLAALLLCYLTLSLFSLLLLPIRRILSDFWIFEFPDFFFYLFINPPEGFYYPVSAMIRLMLFSLLALQLSASMTPHENFKYLFFGVFSGAVFCAWIGLLDFYGIVALKWYRFGTTGTPGVLHSTFGNRGWFGEFILVSVPFALIGFMSKIKRIWWQLLLFASLVVCEITLLLAEGRAGWVSYPVVLFVCWLFFWFTKEGRLESFHVRWKDLIKVAVSVPITIVISLLIVFYAFIPLSDQLKSKEGSGGIDPGGGATRTRIIRQSERLMEPSGRLKAWTQGLDVGRESPIFGLGYESFSWHAHVLSNLPNSFYTLYKENKHPSVLQTPHNIFFSVFVSGGGVGLYMWLAVVGYAVVILTADLIRKKRLLNTPVIICIMSFHIFGIFQSMQYIPMIWFMIFLCLGYAMTIDQETLSIRMRRVSGVLTKTSVVVMSIGIFFYLSNFESRNLAQKYDLRAYALDKDQDRLAGFYQPSQRWTYGDYRWSGKRGTIYVPGGRPIELEFYCMTPGMENEPVTVTVSHRGKVLDEVVFETKSGGQAAKGKGIGIKRQYRLAETPGERQRLDIKVSRTWIPHAYLGNFDRRELGVGVKILGDTGF